MAVADLPDPLEIARLRRDAPARVLQRLEDHGGHRLGALELDRLLDLVRRPERIPVGGPAVAVRVGHVDPAGGERLEDAAQRRDACRRQRSQRRAVVGDLAGDQLDLLAVAPGAVVGAGQLDRGLDRLRPAVGEEDVVQVAGR